MHVTYDGLFTVTEGTKTWTVSTNRTLITGASGRDVKLTGALGQRILDAVDSFANSPSPASTSGVTVPRIPSPSALTYQALIADAESATEPFVDDQTPADHFGVVVKNLGGFQTYWLRGDAASPEQAVVVARTQEGRHFIGGDLLGGRLHLKGAASNR